jgi:hypothetical protein
MNNLCILREPLFCKPTSLKAYLFMAYLTKDKEIVENARRNIFLMLEGAISPLEANLPICDLRDRVRSLRARFPIAKRYLTIEKGEIVGVEKPDAQLKDNEHLHRFSDSTELLFTSLLGIYESFKKASTIQESKNINKRRTNLFKLLEQIKNAVNKTFEPLRYRPPDSLTSLLIYKNIYTIIGRKDSLYVYVFFLNAATVCLDVIPETKKVEILKIFECSPDPIQESTLNIRILCDKQTTSIISIATQVAYEIMKRSPITTTTLYFTPNIKPFLKSLGIFPTEPAGNEFTFSKPLQPSLWDKNVRDKPILFGTGPLLPTY